MRRYSRRLLLRLVTGEAAALGVLAACGGTTVQTGQTATRGSASTSTASVATVATAQASSTRRSTTVTHSVVQQGVKTLTLSGYGDAANVMQRYKAVAAKFDEQFAGRYRMEPILSSFSTYIDKTLTMLSSGTAPDVFNVWAQYKPAWVEKRLLLDMTSHIQASKDASPDIYLKPMVAAMQYQGKFWGTAQDFNGQLLFLNEDLFRARGIALPKPDWTYDDWRGLARELTVPAKHQFGGTNQIDEAGWQQFCIIHNYANHFWVDPAAKKALLDDQGTMNAFTLFQQMAYEDRTLPSAVNPLPAHASFLTGNVAMALGWGNYPYAIYLATVKTGESGVQWTWHTLPAGPYGQQHFSQGHLWSIARENTRPDDAWVLAEWAGGLRGWQAWTAVGKGQPLPLKDPTLWAQYLSFMPKAVAEQFRTFMVDTLYQHLAINFEYWTTYGQCSKIMIKALGEMFGKTPGSVQNALRNATQQMTAILTKSPAG